MTQVNMSLQEIRIKLVKELSKFKCPLNALVLDTGVSATSVSPWKPQFFVQQVESRFAPCVNKILSFNNRLERQKVNARDVKVRILTSQEKDLFFEKTHILGVGQGTALALYDQTILSAMIVAPCKRNTVDAGSYNLVRYATIPEVFVIGGFQKLLSHAQNLFKIKRWVSYADLMVSQGSLYSTNGWKLIDVVKPDYRYLYNGTLHHKFNFRIRRFKEDPNLLFKEGTTEFQLANLNGLKRVYDIGKLKYELVL